MRIRQSFRQVICLDFEFEIVPGGLPIVLCHQDFVDEPVWLSQTINELVLITFEGRIIRAADDPALLRLRGMRVPIAWSRSYWMKISDTSAPLDCGAGNSAPSHHSILGQIRCWPPTPLGRSCSVFNN
jgi:hypothetical protein